ncbi:hypothetical protein BT69DRAFT_303741 [Atractiella rhizophila]|nr:hypothetical protein BT69DRAFT_303741 [Atractiella rhizophila]
MAAEASSPGTSSSIRSDPVRPGTLDSLFNQTSTAWGRSDREKLITALYDLDQNDPDSLAARVRQPHHIETYYRTRAFSHPGLTRPSVQKYIKYHEDLVGFIKNNPNGSIQAFLEDSRIRTDQSCDLLLYNPRWMFLNILYCYDHDTIWSTSGSTFKEVFQSIFPRKKRRNNHCSFKISLEDILATGLRVASTSSIPEHLTIVKGEVLIFRPDLQVTIALANFDFDRNRIANALGVQSMGSEIIASLHGLFGTQHTNELARVHQLLPNSEDAQRLLNFLMMNMPMTATEPNVFASRIHDLEREIRYRNSFHQRLRRDISRNMREQPFLFWGSLFAVIVGICTLIQTVTSVWGLLLAIQAAKQG